MTGQRPKWRRVSLPSLPGLASELSAFQRDVADGHLSVLVGREPDDRGTLSWHLSISHRTNGRMPAPGRYPTWDEITEARYRFVPDRVMVAMLLPPRSEYVDVHPTTFHLWEVDR